jgi:hypothetical protein
MKDEASKALAKYGLSIGFTVDGLPELVGSNGVRCTYSSRGMCPAVGFGAPDGAVSIRRRADGAADLVIDRKLYEFSPGNPANNLEIPKE